MQTFFVFNDPNLLLQRATAAANRRSSGTVPESVKHGVIHTPSPDSTVHHIVTAACPHGKRELANKGIYYRVAYVSIPAEWLNAIDTEFTNKWDITFVGPAGVIQKLPPILSDMDILVGDRIYIGFAWDWLGEAIKEQPTEDKLRNRLTRFVTELREIVQPKLI